MAWDIADIAIQNQFSRTFKFQNQIPGLSRTSSKNF
jgi:hypothetical protein